MLFVAGCSSSVDDMKIQSSECFEWENLEIPVRHVMKLSLDGTDLYAAANKEGLWVRDLRDSREEWKYLGHSFVEGEEAGSMGVIALEVYDGQIRIRSTRKTNEGEFAGIWLSKDRGRTWQPAGQGMRGTGRYSEGKYNGTTEIIRSHHDPDILLAGGGSIFRSEDGGDTWTMVHPTSGVYFFSLSFSMSWHATDPDVVWAYGESGRMAPFLYKSEDQGKTWEIVRNRFTVGTFTSMAFDARDPDIIYLGYVMTPVIRSNLGGEDWKIREYTSTELEGRRSIQTHPIIGGVVIAGGTRLFVSEDHGETVHEIEKPSEMGLIRDMWYDEQTDMLYVAGSEGVIRCQDPIGAIP